MEEKKPITSYKLKKEKKEQILLYTRQYINKIFIDAHILLLAIIINNQEAVHALGQNRP
jgi:hypothetical protein